MAIAGGRCFMSVRSHVLPVVVTLGSWLVVSGQAKRDTTPELPELALEVIQNGYPCYNHVPPPGGSFGMTWMTPNRPDVEPVDGKRIAAHLSFEPASPDSLRVQLTLAEVADASPPPQS